MVWGLGTDVDMEVRTNAQLYLLLTAVMKESKIASISSNEAETAFVYNECYRTSTLTRLKAALLPYNNELCISQFCISGNPAIFQVFSNQNEFHVTF